MTLTMKLAEANEKSSCFNWLISKTWSRLKTMRRKRNNSTHFHKDLSQKIERLENNVIILSEAVERLSTERTQAPIGFTAFVPYTTTVTVGSILNCYQLIKCNLGNCFNPATGVFTAPEDGLFFASITVDAVSSDEVDVLVVKEGQGVRDVVIKVGASAPGTCACGTAVFPMSNGQTLYVKCIGSGGSRVLSCYTSFVCFKIT